MISPCDGTRYHNEVQLNTPFACAQSHMLPCCRFQLPSVWTNASTVDFNFSAFSLSTGEQIVYQWGLGASKGMDDVIPLQPANTTALVRVFLTSSAKALKHHCQLRHVVAHHWGQILCFSGVGDMARAWTMST